MNIACIYKSTTVLVLLCVKSNQNLDRKAALNFFANLSKKRASRRSEKIDYEYISENERKRQLTKVLNTLGKTR